MTLKLLEMLCNSLWQGALLALCAAALIKLLPLSAASRHRIWWLVLLLIPTVSIYSVVTVDRVTLGSVAVERPAVSVERSVGDDLPAAQLATQVDLQRTLPLRTSPSVAMVIVAAWFLLAVLQLIRLGGRLRAARAISRHCLPVPKHVDRRLRSLLAKQSHDGVLSRSAGQPLAFLHPDLRVPVVVGVREPRIILPPSLLEELQPTELLHTLLHELAHIRRRDPWTLLFQQVFVALMPLHPLIRLVSRQIDIERELACDRWVLEQTGGSGKSYAALLVRIGEIALAKRHVVAAVPQLSMASALRRRVQALICREQPGLGQRPRGRFSCVVLLLLFLALTLGLGPDVQVLSAAEPRELDAATRLVESVEHSASLAAHLGNLASASPDLRAQAAFELSAYRGEALPALPALLALMDDRSEVIRTEGKTSKYWGQPGERRFATSPGEEALKTVLYIGKPALQPLHTAIAEHRLGPDHRAAQVARLLADFD